jgi:hypothetical protein
MSDFAAFIESEEPGFLGTLEVIMGLNQAGTASRARQLLNESKEGLAYNNLGALVPIESVLNGNIWQGLRAVTDPAGAQAALLQRKEQIKEMAKQDARYLYNMKKAGNKKPLHNIYRSLIQFVNGFE